MGSGPGIEITRCGAVFVTRINILRNRRTWRRIEA
jgi:hypothetical protein